MGACDQPNRKVYVDLIRRSVWPPDDLVAAAHLATVLVRIDHDPSDPCDPAGLNSALYFEQLGPWGACVLAWSNPAAALEWMQRRRLVEFYDRITVTRESLVAAAGHIGFGLCLDFKMLFAETPPAPESRRPQ